MIEMLAPLPKRYTALSVWVFQGVKYMVVLPLGQALLSGKNGEECVQA